VHYSNCLPHKLSINIIIITPLTYVRYSQKCCPYKVAAEQKARTTYDNILRLVKDPEICDPIRFLRQRELVHFQRFGEGLRMVQDDLNKKNYYAYNPDFDKQFCK